MANMTATTMATWIPKVYSKVATVTLRAKTVLRPLMDHSWESELKEKGGDTVNIPAFSQNSGAVARATFGTAAGLSTELIATTEVQVQLVVNKMAIYGSAVPKEDLLQEMSTYATLRAQGIGESLNLYLDNQLAADNTNGLDGFSTVVGEDNVDLTEDNIITCKVNLNNANAPLDNRYFVISPAADGPLSKIESFRNAQYRSSTGAYDANKSQGFIAGPIHTFMFYMSNNLEAGTSGKKGAAWQQQAIAIAVQQDVKIDREFSVIDGLLSYEVGSIVFGQKEGKDSFGNEVDTK